MLKRSMGIGMLCFAGHAYSAEIAVTTTADAVKDDKECSLREAVEYLNLAEADRPEAGYMGCGGKGASAVIVLEKNKVYRLDKKISIKAAMDIKTLYDSSVMEQAVAGLNNAVIEMAGQDQIFHIDNNDQVPVKVSMKEITFQGCKKSICAAQGGIIYNNETLTLETVKLLNGFANLGGAIYNAGFSADAAVTAGSVTLQNALLENNTAQDGGAIYSLAPGFKIYHSVFLRNTSGSGRAVVYTLNAAADSSKLVFPSRLNILVNSTFFKNNGYAVNLKDGIGLNNLSIIKNAGGVIFDAPEGRGYLANSVVIGNGAAGEARDCGAAGASADKSILFNNLVSQPDCPVGASANQNTVLQDPDVIAGEDEGACSNLLQDGSALFCPYAVPAKAFLGYLRPRMLLSYANVFSSPILNKGQTLANGNANFVYCEPADQRGTARLADNLWCDRGAVEIAVPASISKLGKDIKPGEIVQLNILESLGDSDLIPKEQCNAVAGPNPAGTPWQDGCLKIKQKETASKGRTELNLDGGLTYTPNGSWHGTDDFEIQIITSSTRFNSPVEAKYLSARVTVKQEPDNAMESKTVETSGGALGAYSLAALFGLLGLRRFKK